MDNLCRIICETLEPMTDSTVTGLALLTAPACKPCVRLPTQFLETANSWPRGCWPAMAGFGWFKK
jgi:hypothetical protein